MDNLLFGMELWAFTGFFGVGLLAALSPGPDTLYLVSSTLNYGRNPGFGAVLGVQLGLTFHTLLAVLGISLLIYSNPTVYRVLAMAGAAYLAWLAWEAFHAKSLNFSLSEAGPATRSFSKAMMQALFTNVLNPKALVLFLSIMPGFLNRFQPIIPQLLFMAFTLIFINSIWQSGLVVGAGWLRHWLKEALVQRLINSLLAIFFLLLSGLMLYKEVLKDWLI